MEQLNHTQAIRVLASWTFALVLLACSQAASDQLVDARRAYERAQDGPARTHRPSELRAAKRALDKAEAAHDDDPGSAREKRLAEIAEHRAEVADARGEAAQAELAAQAQRQRANRAAAQLPAPSQPPADDDAPGRVDVKAAEIDARRPAKPAADARGAKDIDDSLQDLMHGSVVREDERDTVIIMSGALLFPSGEDELSDSAEQHLEKVAESLKKQPESTRFRVEGYTDSTGSEQRNQQLSTTRARAIEDYLEDEGIDEDRIESVGYGEQRPIAGNDSDEGRAQNRRVEIVILKGE
jgi:outer membrane protein OmpA-like peptidoglycan-associated protein